MHHVGITCVFINFSPYFAPAFKLTKIQQEWFVPLILWVHMAPLYLLPRQKALEAIAKIVTPAKPISNSPLEEEHFHFVSKKRVSLINIVVCVYRITCIR
jgi:hypothetical protein